MSAQILDFTVTVGQAVPLSRWKDRRLAREWISAGYRDSYLSLEPPSDERRALFNLINAELQRRGISADGVMEGWLAGHFTGARGEVAP